MPGELMHYDGFCYLLYKRLDYVLRSARADDDQDALDAGKALFSGANLDHWAKQADLVKRVDAFLKASRLSNGASQIDPRASDCINALARYIRSGDVLIVRAKIKPVFSALLEPSRGGAQLNAFVSTSSRRWLQPAERDENGFMVMGRRVLGFVGKGEDSVAVYADSVASPASGGLNGGLSGLGALLSEGLSAVAAALPSFEDSDVVDLGNVSGVGRGSTPLGDALPFEYSPGGGGDDLLSIAARGVSETQESKCFADYQTNMSMCDALAGHLGGPRATALCKQNAFQSYQTCRGF